MLRRSEHEAWMLPDVIKQCHISLNSGLKWTMTLLIWWSFVAFTWGGQLQMKKLKNVISEVVCSQGFSDLWSQDALFLPKFLDFWTHGINVIDGVKPTRQWDPKYQLAKLISCVSLPWTAPSTGRHFGSARFVLEELFEPCRRSTCPTKRGVSHTHTH